MAFRIIESSDDFIAYGHSRGPAGVREIYRGGLARTVTYAEDYLTRECAADLDTIEVVWHGHVIAVYSRQNVQAVTRH